MTSDTDRLAALLHAEFITHEYGKGSVADRCGLCNLRAAHLIDAGVTFQPAPDGLREAAREVVRFYGTDRTWSLMYRTLLGSRIDDLRAALQATATPSLDVERLARALHEVDGFGYMPECLETAAALAAEYAALREGETP